MLKKGNTIIKNKIRPLVEDLDSLPMMDVDIFDFEKLRTSYGRFSRLYFKASRGCPFNCSYCVNHAIKSNYPNKRKYVRFYSPERTIQILESILDRNPFLQTVQFADDILPLNKDWFRTFAEKYKKRIKLPYRCYMHLKLVNEEIAELLRESGCYRVNVGIESGNSRVRGEVLNRDISNQEIYDKLVILKKAVLQIHGSSMVGCPTETMDDVLDTIKLSASSSVDIPVVSVLNPYEGTKIYEIAKSNNQLKPERHILNRGSRLKLKNMNEEQVQFAFSSFRSMVFLYRRIFKLPKIINKSMERILDSLYCSKFLPHKILNTIHDKYFNEYILSRIYEKLEKDLVSLPKCSEIKRL